MRDSLAIGLLLFLGACKPSGITVRYSDGQPVAGAEVSLEGGWSGQRPRRGIGGLRGVGIVAA